MSLALRLVAHILPHTASCVCANSAPESNTASSSLRSGNFKTPFSWAVGLGKNVNVISQTVRTCMQIPCTHEAPSVPQPQVSALTRHSGTRSWRHGSGCGILADLHYHAPTRQRAWVREHSDIEHRTQWCCPVSSKSHRYDVPEVEFKKMTPILRYVCLSGLKRMSCSANSKSSTTLAQGALRRRSGP